MSDLDHLTDKELLNDRAASIADIKTITKLAVDAIWGRPREKVIADNKQIVKIIEKELDKRGVAY